MSEDRNYYCPSCLVCDSTVNLAMFAHRKGDNRRIVGWVFLCPACAVDTKGKYLDLQLHDDKQEEDPNADGED